MINNKRNSDRKVPADEQGRKLLEKIGKAIKEIDYGYIQITIHDSKVVQIDKTVRIREKI